MAASHEEAEDEIAPSMLWLLVNVAGTKGQAVQWVALNTHCHSGREGSLKPLPKSLWVKFSHEAQIFSVDFRDMKDPALCSAYVGNKKTTNHSNNFSAGTEVFFFIFIKLIQEDAKWRLLNLNTFQCTGLEI